MNNIEIFGKNLRAARKRRNLSVAELADKTGINEETIYRYERSKRHNGTPVKAPSLDIAIDLAKALDTSLDGLCGLTETGK